jgi:predicted Zn-dependent protease
LALHNLGVAYEKIGELDQAVSALRRALGENPARRETHLVLAAVLERQGKTAEARAAAEEAARLAASP